MPSKKEFMIGLGFKPSDDEQDDDMSEDMDASDDSDREEQANEAIDTFLDDKEDIEVRREAFRRAVKLCGGEY